jgi:uncharacterized protein (TIGR03435 family)
MNSEDSLKKVIDRHLPSPSQMELTASHDRLLRELRSTPPHLQRPRIADAAPPVASWSRAWRTVWRPAVSLATAAAIIAIVAAISFRRGDWIATVEAADGSRYTLDANEVLRLSDAAMLTLADGSHVEVRSQSELSLVREADGLGIRLQAGDIIVDAAEQRDGHLYVHTKDMTVAVAGTVFLVNAGADGSRVAVIDGEVAVRERGAPETRLKPGEQVATSPRLAARSVRDDLTWSRHAAQHLSILASFQQGMTNTAGRLEPLRQAAQSAVAPAAREFEEASVRPCDPDNLPALPEGARGGGANSFYMTPGRTYALCMTVATLIRTAYNFGPMGLEFSRPLGTRAMGPTGRGLSLNGVFGLGREDGLRVRGGPDWVRSEPFTIEAVAGGAANAETMRGPMLLALLESRFKLKAHIETELVPAFTLTVAPGGLKMKPVQATGITVDGVANAGVKSDTCEPTPPPNVPARSPAEVRGGAKPSCGITQSLNGPNIVLVGGAGDIPTLAGIFARRLGNVRVTDMTGTTGFFDFIFEFAIDENTPGQVFGRQLADDPAAVPKGQTIFAALEQQLGLRLEPARAPREFIVIDHIERPSPN